jgi:hypothetical protein
LGAGVTGRGSLLGLGSVVGSSPEPNLRVRPCMAVERDTSRLLLGLKVALGNPLTGAFMEVEGTTNCFRVLLGRKGSTKGVMGTDIPLGLGPSCDSSCVPSDVTGLVKPVFDDVRLCARELFGRPRFCNNCGRTPEPTLAEKELLEVFLEVEEFDRDDTEDEKDELRPGPAFAVVLTAGLTVLVEGGAGMLFLMGSPAFSTNVLLFDGGSGTGEELSEQWDVECEVSYGWKGHACELALVAALFQRCGHCLRTLSSQ